MTDARAPRHPVLHALAQLLSAPRFAAALAVTMVSTVLLSHALRAVMGWAGLLAIVSVLAVLAIASLLAQRDTLDWHGLLPLSLIVFLGWSAASVLWSEYQWISLGGVAYQVAIAVLGVYVALARDTIQLVRSFGDALRVVLGLSVVLEVLAGVLLDMPFPFLRIAGDLAEGGPIQGVAGSRNQLGLIALIAVITFACELLTRSVRRGVAIGSLVLATVVLLLVRSPITSGVVVVLAIAALALLGLRRASAETRPFWELGIAVTGVVLVFAAFLLRGRILTLLDATSEAQTRLGLWRQLLALIDVYPLEGWGWAGYWRPGTAPFTALRVGLQTPSSGLNAFLDVWFQLGVIGMLAFIVLLVLATVRAWLTAARKRTLIAVWPALVLVVLAVESFAESSVLVEVGWFTLVACAVNASRAMSWRRYLRDIRPTERPSIL